MSSFLRPLLLLQAFLSLIPEATSRPTSGCQQQGGNGAAKAGRAIYFITNDEANAVVALSIDADGSLSSGTVTETGGAGSVALNSDNQPALPDALVSQSALTIAGSTIFAVNAGSNTLSMLAISKSDPTKLSLVGKPVAIPGEFANTVTASLKNKIVCVGTSGALAGVSCGSFSANKGLCAMDDLRPFDLGQTTPPVGPLNTVSQTFFSADESMLFTTVKGDPPNNKTGSFSAFPVQRTGAGGRAGSQSKAVVSSVEQRSTPEGTLVLFGSEVIPGTSNVFATDAAFGAAILSVDPVSGQATTIATGEVQGQVATCWVAVSPATGTAFVTDVGANRLVEMSTQDASVLSELDLSANGNPGLIDLRAAGNFIYALSPGNGTTEAAITVVDVSGGSGSATMIQNFELSGVAGPAAMGMAVLV